MKVIREQKRINNCVVKLSTNKKIKISEEWGFRRRETNKRTIFSGNYEVRKRRRDISMII